MAVRGVYTEAEQKMIDDTNKKADELTGWMKSETKLVATEESMKLWANAADYWNPLWRDDDYARNTRWGGIIAAPLYQDRFWRGGVLHMQENQECRILAKAEIGGEYEFFKPIRVNDEFHIWNRRPVIEDATASDENSPRSFNITSIVDFINQKGELVSTTKWYAGNLFFPGMPAQQAGPPGGGHGHGMQNELHRYSKEELELIDRTEKEEEIRGADIRYWEDVEVGDELKPVILGPTTSLDMIHFDGLNIVSLPPTREMRKDMAEETKVDPETGVTHLMRERFYSDRPAHLFGGKYAAITPTYNRSLMTRLVTNWMGDDGFLRKFYWRNRGIDLVGDTIGNKKPAGHIIVGDTLVARGKVTEKRVENGEHIVDIMTWLENIEGGISTAANITISLYSKEAPHIWQYMR